MNALEALALLGPAISDPWVVVDDQEKILEFNSAFFALFPRSTGRNLKKLSCTEVAKLPGCGTGQCLRARCETEGAFRLDEVDVEVGADKLRLIISAAPLTLASGKIGALLVLRNVTDDAKVQQRYQRMVEEGERARVRLETELDSRSRELLGTNEELTRLEEELARLRKLLGRV
jgi:hypothetical protein